MRQGFPFPLTKNSLRNSGAYRGKNCEIFEAKPARPSKPVRRPTKMHGKKPRNTAAAEDCQAADKEINQDSNYSKRSIAPSTTKARKSTSVQELCGSSSEKVRAASCESQKSLKKSVSHQSIPSPKESVKVSSCKSSVGSKCSSSQESIRVREEKSQRVSKNSKAHPDGCFCNICCQDDDHEDDAHGTCVLVSSHDLI